MSGQPSIAAIVVAHNGGEALRECIESLLRQGLADMEIIVVDNASTDNAVQHLEARFGQAIRIVHQQTNGGYAAGANAGCRIARAELIAILNQDLVLMPDCLGQMRGALLAGGKNALVTPKLVLKSDQARVNAVGNDVHLSGVAWCHGLGSAADDWHGTVEVTAVSGAAFMARASFLAELGGLEESYFMYMEDVDLSLRARLAGGRCLAACDAVAVHDWTLALGPARFALMERNRRALWQRFWGRYPRTYPLLLQAELMAWCYALTRGVDHLRAKMNAGSLKTHFTTPVPSSSARLYPVLARHHPYKVLFPNTPLVARAGGLVDRLFSVLVPSS